ncbi:ABC transporter substrate-binding protein [Hydrogenophaga sp. PAMC20947]|nr:ABC transporter substrate-binding protein [Hydrogenophaga sp. PAMC20947]
MATRLVLAELLRDYLQATGVSMHMESVGGVDAARRVASGEPFDVVILASDAIDRLIAAGQLAPGSRADLVRSEVAVAVKAGSALPDLSTEGAVRNAVLAAFRIGYSTGPSGTALLQLFKRWGIDGAVQERLVQARAGVSVASLLASGEVDLGFQQLSELLEVPVVQVVGCLPEPMAIVTTFSAAWPCNPTPASQEAVRGLLAFLQSDEADAVKRRHGMLPV